MRILGYMVVKNEASRYLSSVLTWHVDLLDEIAVYDDQSTDETAEICEKWVSAVKVRAEGVPSFLEHEGRFRQAAWDWFEESLKPVPGDWVLALDADEFLVAQNSGTACTHDLVMEEVSQAGNVAGVVLPVPEVFSTDGVSLSGGQRRLYGARVRVDGQWGRIAGPRLFPYRPGGIFNDRSMASGAHPNYVERGPFYRSERLALLHYGYAVREDVNAKFERYSNINHHHADSHIASIPLQPTLRAWKGELPWVIRSIP